MAKKNIFSDADVEKLKDELDKSLSELAALPIEKAEDEMDWRSSINGLSTPFIISSIEDKLKTAMTIIADSTEQLKVLHNEEGYSSYVESKVFILENKIAQIQDFYEVRTYSDVTHRFLEKEMTKTNSKGTKTTKLRLLAATKEEQTKTRSSLLRSIYKVKPTINSLKSVSGEEVVIKGKKVMPLSLKGITINGI